MNSSSDHQCMSPKTDLYLLAVALKSFFLVIATHLLAGEVDTTTLSADTELVPARLFWLLRYYNPVNLLWRYYSIFAYRLTAGRSWGEKQMAIINYEGHPCQAPVPYVITETIKSYKVRRLEPSGIFSSQGLLTVTAGYQGILAIQYSLSRADYIASHINFLPNITMPFAIMGLIRVFVYPWITSKVYVDPYDYPCDIKDIHISPYKASKLVATATVWLLVLALIAFLTLGEMFLDTHSHSTTLPHRVILTVSAKILYRYLTVSILVFHVRLLWEGARGWGNRIKFFNHWIYKVQSVVFFGLLGCTLALGIADFIEHGYYRHC